MAQDATGTPTSQGIPKYNTAADAPSGKGFNAAMDAIDALIVARGLPAAPDTNEPLYWNGSAWVTNKLTDAQIDMTSVLPPGIVACTAGAAAPSGWVICDGSAISRTTFAALFAVIGTTFGIGDGSSTYNVPNLKGRVVHGIDAGQTEFDTRGDTGGAKTHTLITAEIPSHAHQLPMQTSGNQSGGYGLTPSGFFQDSVFVLSGFSAATSNTGGGGAHNNLQPYMALHYIIKL